MLLLEFLPLRELKTNTIKKNKEKKKKKEKEEGGVFDRWHTQARTKRIELYG